jgi:4-hydroxythreonine-4-phosphate dehydrogenase
MRATLGITAGDPVGIGLEVTLKALPHVLNKARWVLFTTPSALMRNAPALPYRWMSALDDISDEHILHVYSIGDGAEISWGQVSSDAGAEALACLEAAGSAALASRLHGIVTAPVNKYAIGKTFHGQTDFLAAQAKRPQFAMAFFAPTMKVVLATIHMSLRDALSHITTDLYIDLIRFVDLELQRFRFASRRIAVAAINPHAGEGGMFGDEDDRILRPAVERCAAEGIDVTGPHSADSLYFWAHSGGCDVVIAPYHDQGLIPVKLMSHGESTNVTLGLPYIRTSPDHGTAFDIAGKGIADPRGMISAMNCAVDLHARQLLQRP